ncbi:polyprenyl synthetase family protein [Candidatus Woesearchaeota archaeon]|nr:polyprenyl synthetase family protein [Candidatus Woesearchaeota archaeon]
MNQLQVKDTINAHQKLIEHRLTLFFDEKLNKCSNISPLAKELVDSLKEFSLRGGKRIRPILAIFGYKAIKEQNEAVLQAALAVELMESFLLIHDDILDQDDFRRGYYSMHKVYELKAKKLYPDSDAAHFGRSMAIMAGDLLASFGSECITRSDFPAELKIKAIDKFNRVIINTAFGEVMDIVSELKPEVSELDIIRVNELKTAIYTIEGPLHIGAILAGASRQQLDILTKYAIPLGQAYQIHDDILGMFGNEKKLGKPVGSDLREGKKTILILKALQLAKQPQVKSIMAALGNKSITREQIDEIRNIVLESGALDYCQNLVRQLSEQAKTHIRHSGFRPEGKSFLLAIADYMTQRDK